MQKPSLIELSQQQDIPNTIPLDSNAEKARQKADQIKRQIDAISHNYDQAFEHQNLKQGSTQQEILNIEQESENYLIKYPQFNSNQVQVEIKDAQQIQIPDKQRQDNVAIQNIYKEVNNDIQNTMSKAYEEQLKEKMQKQRDPSTLASKSVSIRVQEEITKHLQYNKRIQQRQMEQLSKAKAKGKQKHQQANELKERWKQNLILTYNYHKLQLSDIFSQFSVNPAVGLSNSDAEKRIKTLGPNKITEEEQHHWYMDLLSSMFSNMFNDLLWCGATACLIAYALSSDDPQNLYLGVVIYLISSFSSYMGFAQERNSRKILQSFHAKRNYQYAVVRQGLDIYVGEEELTTGDIITITQNQRIPCDIRIIECSNDLQVDNSILTGDVEPQHKQVECMKYDSPLQATNLLLAGTNCIQGQAKGLVINIGDETIFGQILQIARKQVAPPSPLKKDITSFVQLLGILSSILSVVFAFVAYYVQKFNVIQLVVLFIGLIVANVPTGLVGSISILLTIVAKQLQKKSIVVRNLETVESLGSITCVMSDIEFTQNQNEVKHFWFNNQLYNEFDAKISDEHFQLFQKCALLSNDAVPNNKNEPKKSVDSQSGGSSESTEQPIVTYFNKFEDVNVIRSKYHFAKQSSGKDAKMSYNQIDKFSVGIVEETKENSFHTVFVKGDPIKLWHFSKSIMINNQMEAINDQLTNNFEQINKQLGRMGEKVQGFAYMDIPKEQFPIGSTFVTKSFLQFNFSLQGMTFVGLAGFHDKPKKNVPEAIQKCQMAGIKFIMATDEQIQTAVSIARMVNILPQNVQVPDELMDEYKSRGEIILYEDAFAKCDAIVISGEQFRNQVETDRKNEKDFKQSLQSWLKKPYLIFANITPDQKLEIVKTCQQMGHTIGVIGTGINDSPALKQADIGMTMGITGSNSAKDSADMIFMNDDFSLIADCVLEGRRIFDNLKKVIIYVLTATIPEFLPYAISIVLNMPIAIQSVQCLCVDIGCNVYPSIALGYEEPEQDIMKRKPRKKDEHLCTVQIVFWTYLVWGFFEAFAGLMMFYAIMYHFGYDMGEIMGIIGKDAYPRPPNDRFYQYNPSAINLGNPSLDDDCRNTGKGDAINWFSNLDGKYDLRYIYVKCDHSTGKWGQSVKWGSCQKDMTSFATNTPICYSTEALKYANTCYYSTIMLTQIFNVHMMKARYQNFFTSSFNRQIILGIAIEISLCCALAYIPGLQLIFNFRPVSFLYLFCPGTITGIVMLLLNELRKYLIRNPPRLFKEFIQKNVFV